MTLSDCERFLETYQGVHVQALKEFFKLQAEKTFEAFSQSENGRALTDEEIDCVFRWMATAHLSLASFTLGRTRGSLETALTFVREEFRRSLESEEVLVPRVTRDS